MYSQNEKSEFTWHSALCQNDRTRISQLLDERSIFCRDVLAAHIPIRGLHALGISLILHYHGNTMKRADERAVRGEVSVERISFAQSEVRDGCNSVQLRANLIKFFNAVDVCLGELAAGVLPTLEGGLGLVDSELFGGEHPAFVVLWIDRKSEDVGGLWLWLQDMLVEIKFLC